IYRTREEALPMCAQRAVDCLVARGPTGGGVESGRLGMEPQCGASLVEPTRAEQRRGRRPERAVAARLFGAQLRGERGQLREVCDRVDLAERRDADDAVCIEIGAEQKRGVGVARRKEPRRAGVDEGALVDRLEAERVPLLAERREDRVALGGRPARVA